MKDYLSYAIFEMSPIENIYFGEIFRITIFKLLFGYTLWQSELHKSHILTFYQIFQIYDE